MKFPVWELNGFARDFAPSTGESVPVRSNAGVRQRAGIRSAAHATCWKTSSISLVPELQRRDRFRTAYTATPCAKTWPA